MNIIETIVSVKQAMSMVALDGEINQSEHQKYTFNQSN